MRKLFQGRWSIVFGFVAAFLGLAGLNVFIFQSEIDISPLASPAPAVAQSSNPGQSSARSLTADLDLPETLTRPVFSPTRRDFVAPPPTQEPIADPVEEVEEKSQVAKQLPPAIKLRGTRVVDGKLSALIAVNDKDTDWFAQNGNIQGWTITSITPERISLTSGSQSAVFSLYETKVDVVDSAE